MIRLFLLACASLALLSVVPGRSATWDPDTRVVQDTSGAGQHETTLSVNPLNVNNAVVVFKDYRAAERNYLDTTTDGGATWHEQPFPDLSPVAPGNTDPAVFFRRDGRVYIVWTAIVDWPDAGLYCAWSDDGGFTWSTPTQITPLFQHYDDKAWLAFDTTGGPHDGTIYVGWTRFGTAELAGIDVAHSTDGGATWSPAIQVSAGDWADNDDGAQWAILPDGTALLVFLHADANGKTSTLVLSRSTDGGVTFGANTPLFSITPLPYTLPNEHWRIFTYPSLAYDPVRGWLSLVWADYSAAATNGADILFNQSTDAGATWSTPIRLNDDPPNLVRDQWFPVLAAAPDGRLTALWLDRRDDPANARYHAYVRTSLDGGLTWAPSERVSSASSDPNQNIPPGSDGIGDYIGMAAGPGVMWGAWVDVRNGDQDIYAARELFTPQPTPTPGPPTPSPVPPSATPTVPTPTPGPLTATPTAPPPSPTSPSATPLPPSATPAQSTPSVPPSPGPATVTPAMTPSAVPATITPTPPCTAHFSDVHPADYFYTPVLALACRGVISGYADGTFRPYALTTRAQVVKIVVGAFGLPLAPTPTPAFADVPATHPFFPYIMAAAQAQVISGYTCGGPGEPCDAQHRPYFRPSAYIGRGQLAKIVVAAAGWPLLNPPQGTFADVAPGSAFYPFVETAVARGILSGYACGGPGEPCDPQHRPYFRQYNNATRGQIAKIVYNAVGRVEGSGAGGWAVSSAANGRDGELKPSPLGRGLMRLLRRPQSTAWNGPCPTCRASPWHPPHPIHARESRNMRRPSSAIRTPHSPIPPWSRTRGPIPTATSTPIRSRASPSTRSTRATSSPRPKTSAARPRRAPPPRRSGSTTRPTAG